MKKILLLLIAFSCLLTAIAQKKTKKEEAFYMLDENYKGTTQEQAKFFIHAEKLRDSCWQFDTYNISGSMISSEQCKDEKGTISHGKSVYFNARGTRDSMGDFRNGARDGYFYYFNDTGRVYIQKQFRNDTLIETVDRIKKDSADEAARKMKHDTITNEKESEFPGGAGSWAKYLTKNLVYPQRAQNLGKTGTVAVQFVVNTDGVVSDYEIVQSVEYSLDQEALRMIIESPAWVPAFQNGKKVKSYKKQPLTFKL